MKNSTHLIFDFDGTLVDSFNTIIEKFNLLADEFNYQKVSSSETNKLKNLTSSELIKYLKIPLTKIPDVLHHIRIQMQNEMQTLLPFANLHPVLTKLHTCGFSLGIVSSNSSENVTAWLERNNMRNLFNFIHAESSYYGKSLILNNILDSYQMDKAKTFYIGDETRDIEAAKESHIHSIAVAWGFNSEKILTLHEPNYIAREPQDILNILLKEPS